MIEVKSDYTYTINSELIEIKRNACINYGYIYEIWIFNRQGVLTIV